MDFIKNDMPSMDNIYNSDYYKQTRAYEQGLSDNAYAKAEYPFKTGFVPSYVSPSVLKEAEIDNEPFNKNYVKSLTGNVIPVSKFEHQNMQYFLKKGITQNTNVDNNSAFHQHFGYNEHKGRKSEVEGFFDPTPNLGLVKGMQNADDFLRERTTVSKIQNNYNPIQSVKVAPGLNMGYTSEGTGGFQQFDLPNLVKPKQREELRPKSDQRSSLFEIPIQAPKKNPIEKRGIVQPFVKNKPETVYNQTEENWIKGQSTLKKDSMRPDENLKDTTRIGSHINYYGTTKIIDEFFNNKDDYGKNSILIYDTEKHEVAKKEVPVANLSSIIKGVTAPVIDALKISLKEYLLTPERELGHLAPQQPEKQTTYDPVNHIMKTTVKETTLNESETINLTGNKETYTALYDDAKTTVKETMLNESEKTNLTGNKETYSALYDDAKTTVKETIIHESEQTNLTGNKETYSALYDDAKTTVKETIIHDTVTLNIKGDKNESYLKNNDITKTTIKETLPKQDNIRNINNVSYHSTYVYDPSIVAKKTLKETLVNGCNSSAYGFIGGFLNSILGGYTIRNDNAKNTQKQFSHIQYDGGLKSVVTFVPMDRDADYNAEIDGTRELIMMKAGYTPNGSGNYVGVDKKNINMDNKKQLDIHESPEPIRNPNKIYQISPLPVNEQAVTKTGFKENAYTDRLDSAILTSLLENKNAIKVNPIRIDCDSY